MRVSFIPKKYGEKLTCDGMSVIPKKNIEDLVSEFEDKDLRIEEVNYGKGADWIWILLI